MPQVPIYNTPSVQSEGPGSMPNASLDSFGAGIGRGLVGLGNQLEKTGDTLEKHAVKFQDRLNATEAKEALLNGDIALGELEAKFRSLEGKAAVAAYPEFVANIRKLRDDTVKQIQNPEVRHQYDQAITSRLANSIITGARYTAQQNKKYIVGTNKALVDRAVEDSAEDPDNEARFVGNMKILNGGVDALANETGMSSDEAKEYKKNLESRAWGSRIAALATTDPGRAAEMYEANKDKLSLQDRQNVESTVLKGRTMAASIRTKATYDMQQSLTADINSVSATGVGNDKLTYADVARTLGAGEAEVWQMQRAQAHAIWTQTHDLGTMTPEQISQRRASLIPQAGDEQYDRKMNVLNAYDKTAEFVQSMRRDDPAKSVAYDPEVAQAAASANFNDLESIQNLSNARLAAQARAGIPPSEQSPITKDEALNLTAPLRGMFTGQEKSVITNLAQTFEKLYGDKAQQAFVYALKAHNLDTETAATAANVMRQIGLGRIPDQAQQVQDQQKSDVGAANQATDEITAKLGKVPQKAVDYLLANPKSLKDFEAKYGSGVGKHLLETYRGKQSAIDDGGLELSAQRVMDDEPQSVLSDDQLEDVLKTIPENEITQLQNDPTDANIDAFVEKYGEDATRFLLDRPPAGAAK